MQILENIQARLQGYKTYILCALWLVAEIAAYFGWITQDIVVSLRAVVFPLLGITVTAKLNRNSL